jgi:hypothetical protein
MTQEGSLGQYKKNDKMPETKILLKINRVLFFVLTFLQCTMDINSQNFFDEDKVDQFLLSTEKLLLNKSP